MIDPVIGTAIFLAGAITGKIIHRKQKKKGCFTAKTSDEDPVQNGEVELE